jgi:hypothetical protein
MKWISLVQGLVAAFLVTSLAGEAHSAVTLTVEGGSGIPGAVVPVRISAEDPSGIAGAAFTIAYDAGHLILTSVVDSSFFDAFARGPEIPGTGVRICGARRSTGSTQSTLLVLHFRIKTDAESESGYVTGGYAVTITETTVFNPAAGYGAPVAIALLTGLAVEEEPLEHPDRAFPQLAVIAHPGVIMIDRDGDGLTDLEEAGLGTDRDRSDSDGDGLPDGWEAANGLDPRVEADAVSDRDWDGFSNLREFLSGTNPRDPQDRPSGLMGDLDGDGDVDGRDLSILVSILDGGLCAACPADFNRDGRLDPRDVLLFSEDFGAP